MLCFGGISIRTGSARYSKSGDINSFTAAASLGRSGSFTSTAAAAGNTTCGAVPSGSFAITGQEVDPFVIGEGIAGQAAEDKKPIRINDIPENYFDVSSGLGNSKPKHLMFIPIVYKNQTIALIEAGSFEKPDEKTELVLDKISIEAGKLVYKFLNN